MLLANVAVVALLMNVPAVVLEQALEPVVGVLGVPHEKMPVLFASLPEKPTLPGSVLVTVNVLPLV
jgi:hypothetical protein